MAIFTEKLQQFYWSLNSTSILAKRPKEFHGSNRSYSRFIVLAHQRSGSSMVIATLNKHAEIVAFGELFVKRRIGYFVPGFNGQSKALRYLRNTDPVRFLEEHAFSSFPDRIKAVGFKLFPDHLDNQQAAPLWKWLEKNKGVKIIFLTRENLLDVYCSLIIANKTGNFGYSEESGKHKITINIEHAEKEFEKRISYMQEARAKLNEHQVLDLSYETLTKNIPASFERLQSFIGVDQFKLDVPTRKQETRPLSEIIENYGELCRAWKGTAWEQFL